MGTHLFPGRQDFCIASTVYLKNSWASSWLPNLKCFPIPEDKNKRPVVHDIYIYIYNWIILNHSLSLNSSKKTLWLCCLFLYKHQGLTLKGWYDTKVSKPKINFITLSKLRLCHAPLKWLIQTCPHMSTSRCGNICVMPAKCSRKEGVVSVTAVVLKQQGRSSAFLGESKITLFGFPKVDAFRNH